MNSIKIMKLIVFFVFAQYASAQMIHQGKIVYERKTNLYKKFKDDNVADWLKETDKNKTDVFELWFNDTAAVFKPEESDLKEDMSWATSKNRVYQNFKNNTRFTIKSIWGESIQVKDSLYKRTWKITDSKRKICGYNCRKAIWNYSDSVRIYAWYCEEIIPSVGPESFYGLPGAILGLATEDGGVIYFAKSVQVVKVTEEELTPEKRKGKIYEAGELKEKLERQFGKEKWGKAMIREHFGPW